MTHGEAAVATLGSPAAVKALVPDFIFKRAKEVVSSNKLNAISFHGPSLQTVTATCAGSNPGDNYSLSISINVASSCNPICQCSCPAALKSKGNLCKHVVALLLLRTEELAKLTKDQANAAILSGFQLAEDRLAEGRQREPTLSDSQATEVFVPSGKVDNATSTTASSVSPVIKNSQKRVLPSWISEGYCAPKKEVKEKKIVRKIDSTQNAPMKEEGKVSTVVDVTKTVPTGGKGKCRLSNKETTKKSLVKNRNDTETERIRDTDSKAEETFYDCEQKKLSIPGRGNRQQKKASSTKKDLYPAPKKRRTRMDVESDLSEEEEPEIVNDNCSFKVKEDVALTDEDLVNLATEHLENEKSSYELAQNLSAENAANDAPQRDTATSKKSESIFSVQGWNMITTNGLNVKGDLHSQESSKMPHFPSTFTGDLHEVHSQASAERGSGLVTMRGGTTKDLDSLGNANNVVDDMLGLFFGPNLRKATNPRSEILQHRAQDNSSTVAPPEHDMLMDTVLPVSTASVPQPKKKSSLKDKVMMYLG